MSGVDWNYWVISDDGREQLFPLRSPAGVTVDANKFQLTIEGDHPIQFSGEQGSLSYRDVEVEVATTQEPRVTMVFRADLGGRTYYGICCYGWSGVGEQERQFLAEQEFVDMASRKRIRSLPSARRSG